MFRSLAGGTRHFKGCLGAIEKTSAVAGIKSVPATFEMGGRIENKERIDEGKEKLHMSKE